MNENKRAADRAIEAFLKFIRVEAVSEIDERAVHCVKKRILMIDQIAIGFAHSLLRSEVLTLSSDQ